MRIFDTHCHAGLTWFEPVELLLYQMNLNSIEKAVLVQYRGNYHNQYILECAQRFPGRFVPIVCVDARKPDAPTTLETWRKAGAAGVRFLTETRSPGSDPLAIWRKAAQLGMPITILGRLEQFASPEFRQVVAALPECTLILEHLAGMHRSFFTDGATEEPYTLYRQALELAGYSNTYIKIGGLGEFAQRPAVLGAKFSVAGPPPMAAMAAKAFGPRRMMWGSDYPPVSQREGYRNALQGTMEHLAFLSQEDKEWVFGKTADSVWKTA